jgi:hydroxyacylglutathione hydrolase
MNIIKSTVGKWKENSYALKIEGSEYIIDPGDEYTKLKDEFQITHLLGIINTHGHFDHLGAVADFMLDFNAPFYIHSKDKRLVSQANLYRKLAGDNTIVKTPKIDTYFDEIKEIQFLNEIIKIHYTPGHTEGSVSFEIRDNLFVGDLILKDTIGRVDLPGGNIEKLKKSIQFVLSNFKNYIIHPGHGESFILDDLAIEKFNKLI